jgi:ABC-type phosphonate transport system ATPase subunit
MLEMRNIHKSYGSVRANRGIDLTVPPGRIVGLLGENGSEKAPDEGVVRSGARGFAPFISKVASLLGTNPPMR